MIKVSILYPNREDTTFDSRYYLESHMPMAIGHLSRHPGYRGVSVDLGRTGLAPGEKPSFVAMCHFLFDAAESFLEAAAPHSSELQGDIPNYTNVKPIIQFSEVAILN
jgi:uncharacterized protein (TIGR02118 family)